MLKIKKHYFSIIYILFLIVLINNYIIKYYSLSNLIYNEFKLEENYLKEASYN